ncbi:uncharacterized protein LOC119589944 isoform X2 [Penaeus monodon]|uniref:uncharacterized protein LOC119589944 isoform X2 n=1 Tax=Penaeus monodon TaxID=6687 RepID=UPI0018A757F3|nr:uncharacterized protein LOC119589944 isoform X2 [Penaeus monodon]
MTCHCVTLLLRQISCIWPELHVHHCGSHDVRYLWLQQPQQDLEDRTHLSLNRIALITGILATRHTNAGKNQGGRCAGDVHAQGTSVLTAPFQQAGQVMAHAPLAQNSTGPVQVSNINTVRSPKPQRERRVRARPARKVLTGRPMTELCMAGKRLKCFIDTGSSVSLIKYSAILGLHLASRGRAARALAGISGQGLHTIEERDIMVGIPRGERAVHRFIVVKDCQFPGDVLIGIDFLRRFSFTFQHNSRPSYSFLRIGNIELPVTFTDSPSLGVLAVKVKREEIFNLRSLFGSPPLPGARVRRTVMMPPHSGKFVPATVSIPDSDVLVEGNIGDLLIPRSLCRKTSNIINVWVVNLGHKPVKLRNGSFLSVVTPISEFPQVAAADLQEDCTQLTDDNEPPGQLPALNHLSSLQSDALLALLQSHQSLFDGKKSEVGVVPGIYHSIPTGDAQPIMTRQWRLPQISKQIIREECEKMLDSGVIEPSTSPWLSPIVLVKKRDGSHRFCVDFRRINAVTTSDSYPLPRMEELIDTLGKSKIFTVLDARSAYWSIELTPSDRPKTAFSDGAALWQFRRMPYGLKTAGATYQRMINFILSPTLGKHTLAYLDDVVIHSLDFNTHMSDLAETLALLKGAGFKLNVDKCSFAMDSIKLLGFVVSAEGVAPDPAKVKAINEMQTPRSVKEVRSFLGASGFFRRNIEGYATIAAPLTSLTRKDRRECTFPIGMTNHQTRAGHIGGRQLDLIAARDAAVTGTQRVYGHYPEQSSFHDAHWRSTRAMQPPGRPPVLRMCPQAKLSSSLSSFKSGRRLVQPRDDGLRCFRVIEPITST